MISVWAIQCWPTTSGVKIWRWEKGVAALLSIFPLQGQDATPIHALLLFKCKLESSQRDLVSLRFKQLFFLVFFKNKRTYLSSFDHLIGKHSVLLFWPLWTRQHYKQHAEKSLTESTHSDYLQYSTNKGVGLNFGVPLQSCHLFLWKCMPSLPPSGKHQSALSAAPDAHSWCRLEHLTTSTAFSAFRI